MHQLQFSVQSLPKNPRIAIVVAVFHAIIAEGLLKACRETLAEYKIFEVEIIEVPGAFEIPLACKRLAESKKYDCIIALGAVIKGETHHFDLVCRECTRGIMDVMLETHVPIIFEVLATEDEKQALRRSSGDKNKGKEAALSALKILSTFTSN